jgi:hypothetical protein
VTKAFLRCARERFGTQRACGGRSVRLVGHVLFEERAHSAQRQESQKEVVIFAGDPHLWSSREPTRVSGAP